MNDIHSLLAVIHRDGGHYEIEHGLDKAIEEALNIIIEDREYISNLKDDIFHLKQYNYEGGW